VPAVQLVLDHHTVSRRHAEMVCDPFGRWWIRDLGSTNGTLVNDEPVYERVLNPGDRIAIGDYMLTFHLEPPSSGRSTRLRGPVGVDEDRPTAIRTLLDFDPPRIAAEHLFTLMELGRRLLTIEQPGDRLRALCHLMLRKEFHGNLAMVVRVAGGAATIISGPFVPGPGDVANASHAKPYISRRVITSLESTREPVLAGNLNSSGEGKPSLELTLSREVMALWVVACPVHLGEDDLDALYVTLPPECGSVEWLSLLALAAEVYQQSEAAWTARQHALAHAAIERELEMARQIQRGLVPKVPTSGVTIGGGPVLDLALGFAPCKWVGGDYVDVVPLADGRLLFAVADVCGKGLQAALVTSSLHTMVRAMADSGRSLCDLVERVNRHLCAWLPEHSFVTMVALALDPKKGEVECVNAGHPPAILARAGAEPILLQSAMNPALGMADVPFESQKSRLTRDQVLLLYTDGLTELGNPSHEMLGLERLMEGFAALVTTAAGAPAAKLALELDAMLDAFRGDALPEDDRAFLLARFA
jgi:serine phosphatase RsbU (regulator of sigma subunit)